MPASVTAMPQAPIEQNIVLRPPKCTEDAALDMIDIYDPCTYIHIAQYGVIHGSEALAKLLSRVQTRLDVDSSAHWKQILAVLKISRGRSMASSRLPVPKNTFCNPHRQIKSSQPSELAVGELCRQEDRRRATEAERARQRINPRWPTVNWAEIETAALPRYESHVAPSQVPDLVVTTTEGELRRLQDINIYWSVLSTQNKSGRSVSCELTWGNFRGRRWSGC